MAVSASGGLRLSESHKLLLDLWEGVGTVVSGSTHDGSNGAIRRYLESKGVKGYLERSGVLTPGLGGSTKNDESIKPEGDKEDDLTKFME